MNTVIEKIKLCSTRDVKDFVFAISALPKNVQVKVRHSNSVADGKGILGVLNLSTNGIVEVSISETGEYNEKEIRKTLNQWIVEE